MMILASWTPDQLKMAHRSAVVASAQNAASDFQPKKWLSLTLLSEAGPLSHLAAKKYWSVSVRLARDARSMKMI
jgi:hypothetical protein